jgi:hypothetical protein
MATMPAAPKTVGDLIERLEQFERGVVVVAANALTGTADDFEWILTVAPLPPTNEKVAILYLPKEQAIASA